MTWPWTQVVSIPGPSLMRQRTTHTDRHRAWGWIRNVRLWSYSYRWAAGSHISGSSKHWVGLGSWGGRPLNPCYLSGLCRGLSNSDCPSPQLLSGGTALVLLWEPPASAGCGCSETLHSHGESWSWGPAGAWKGQEAKIVEGHFISNNFISIFYCFFSYHFIISFYFILSYSIFLSFPLRRIVVMIAFVRTTSASPSVFWGELFSLIVTFKPILRTGALISPGA